MWVSIGALVLGLCLLGYYLWQRAGRSAVSRGWATAPRQTVNNAMLTRPGAGLVLLAVTCHVWADASEAGMAVVLLLGVSGFVLIGWAMWSEPALWMLPAWSREQVASRRERDQRARRRRRERRRAR